MMVLDESGLPLVVWIASGVSDAHDADVLLGGLETIVARGLRYVTLFDALDMRGVSIRELRRLAEFVKANEVTLATLCRAQATVITSPLIRATFQVFLWMQPLPYPHELFDTRADGMRYLERMAGENGLSLPPGAGR